jgi:hypothetical protein
LGTRGRGQLRFIRFLAVLKPRDKEAHKLIQIGLKRIGRDVDRTTHEVVVRGIQESHDEATSIYESLRIDDLNRNEPLTGDFGNPESNNLVPENPARRDGARIVQNADFVNDQSRSRVEELEATKKGACTEKGHACCADDTSEKVGEWVARID